MVGDQKVAAILNGPAPNQGDTVHLQFQQAQTRVYADGWLATEEARA
jgi:glycerol transport system ATP-binding protein